MLLKSSSAGDISLYHRSEVGGRSDFSFFLSVSFFLCSFFLLNVYG